MIGDDHTMNSIHDSVDTVDTAATCKTDNSHYQSLGDENDCGNSVNYTRIGSKNTRSSLEAIRQDERKSQAIVNALNHFIFQAGNIYKGNELSALDVNRLRGIAHEAGLSIKVVDALIEQTADQNAMVDYCMTSDDVFARKIKEDPNLSRALYNPDRNDGLNLSNSLWRIFLHKIIKQFLKEQNMQLEDIVEKSDHTRRLFEDALICSSKEKSNLNTSRISRDYSEERKHVLITKDEAKQARIEASQAMVNFEHYKSSSVYDLVNGASIRSDWESPTAMPQHIDDTHHLRDENLSMVPCPGERRFSSSIHRLELNDNTGRDMVVADKLPLIPVASEQNVSTIRTESLSKTNDNWSRCLSEKPIERNALPIQKEIDPETEKMSITSHCTSMREVSRTTSTTSPIKRNKNSSVKEDALPMHKETGPEIETISSTPMREVSQKTSTTSTMARNEKNSVREDALPMQKETDAETEKMLTMSQCTPNKVQSQRTSTKSAIAKKNNSSIKQRIAMYESGAVSPHPYKESPQTKSENLEQNYIPSGNILQARAIFEKKGQESKTMFESGVISPHRCKPSPQTNSPAKNILQARAIFEQKGRAPETRFESGSISPQAYKHSPQTRPPSGDILQALAIFEKKSQESKSLFENGAISPLQYKYSPKARSPSGIILQTRDIFEKKSQEPKELFKSSALSPHGYHHSAQINSQSGNILQARVLFEKQNREPKAATEPARKRQSKNIHQLLSTWTQKEQENLTSPKKDTENRSIEANCMEILKQDVSGDLLKAAETRLVPVRDVNGVERFFKSLPIHRSDPTPEDESPAGKRSKRESEGYTKNEDKGLEKNRVFLNEEENPEFKLNWKPSKRRNEAPLHDVKTNVVYGDIAGSGLSLEKNLRFLPPSLDRKLSSIDKDRDKDQESEPAAKFESNNRNGQHEMEGEVEDCNMEGLRKTNTSTAQIEKWYPHSKKSNELMMLPSVKNDGDFPQGSYLRDVLHEDSDHTNGQYLEQSIVNTVRKDDKTNINRSEIDVIENDMNDSLAYVNTASDDSSWVPMPPTESPPSVGAVKELDNEMAQFTNEEDCGQTSSLPAFGGTLESTELSDGKSWTKFAPRNNFHDQSHECSNQNDRAEDERHDIVQQKRSEFPRSSGHPIEQKTLDHKAFDDFGSKNMFRQESLIIDSVNNMERILNAKDSSSSRSRNHFAIFNDSSNGNEISVKKLEGREEGIFSNLHSTEKPSHMRSTSALPSPASSSQKNLRDSSDTGSASFTVDPYPEPLYHRKSIDKSFSQHEIEKVVSVKGNKHQSNLGFPMPMENGEISRTSFQMGAHGESSEDNPFRSRDNRVDNESSLNRQNQIWETIDKKFGEEASIPSYTAAAFFQTSESTPQSKHSESLTSSLTEGSKTTASELKKCLPDAPNDGASGEEQNYFENVRCIEQLDCTALNGEKEQPKRIHGANTKFERENTWENFVSNFDVKSQRDYVPNVSSQNGALNHASGEGEDEQEIPTHTLSTWNEFADQAVKSSSRHSNALDSPTDTHLKNQSSNPVEEISTNEHETGQFSKEFCSIEEREVSENGQYSEQGFSSRNLMAEDTQLREGPETDSEENSLKEGSDTVNTYRDANNIFDSIMPSTTQRYEYTLRAGNQTFIANVDNSTASMKNCDEKLESGGDHGITLTGSESVRDHGRGIVDLLEQREDLLEESVACRRYSFEEIRTNNIQQTDDDSLKRDHLGALNKFLVEYQPSEKQEGHTSEVGRSNVNRDNNDTIEERCDLDFENKIEGRIQRDAKILKKSDTTPRKNNSRRGHLDVLTVKSSSTFSEASLLDAVADDVEQDEENITKSSEVSWPVDDEARGNREGPISPNEPAYLKMGQQKDQDLPRDFQNPSDYDRLQPVPNNSSPQRHSKFTSTRYEPCDKDSDYAEHMQHQYEHHHRRRRDLGPIIRVLDRPLLDLDEGESLDAIEVERQNSNDSSWFEPESRTASVVDNQTYQIDPKPDPLPPLPDPSPRENPTVSIASPTSKNCTEIPEGATKEELNLLNHFIDVASSNFGGNMLSAESESRVRSAALKVGLTSKFVDQLLDQTMKQREVPGSGSAFIDSRQHQYPHDLPQTSYRDQEDGYSRNYFAYQHGIPKNGHNDYRADNETDISVDYSRTNTNQNRRRHERDAKNCNAWDSFGKNLGFLSSLTARVCGVNYHSGRDDESSVVSAISWEGDATGASKAKKRRSRNLRESEDGVENIAAADQNDQRRDEGTRRVTFASTCVEHGDGTGQEESNFICNDLNCPPRQKITQLV